MKASHLALFPFFLVFYEIGTYLSNDMYLPALPNMMQDLSLNSAQAQFTLTMWFIGQAILPLLIGVMSDRLGRRPILLGGGIIYILATILCAVSHDVNTLLLGRLIEGSMVATMLVPGYAAIHELYEQNEAIKILALMSSISVLAPALGPLFGSVVLLISSWRGIFWVIALWCLIAIFYLWKLMPETQPKEKREPIQLPRLVKSYFSVVTNSSFMLLMFVTGFIFAGWIAWISAGALLIIEKFHYSALAFGIIQAVLFAVYILGNHLVKYLVDKLGAIRLIRLGLMITLAGGILVLITSIIFPNTLYPFLAAMLLYSLGSSLCFSPLNRLIIESSNEPMGIRVATFTVFFSGFAAFGSAMAGLFFIGSIASLAYLIAGAIIISYLIKPFTKIAQTGYHDS